MKGGNRSRSGSKVKVTFRKTVESECFQ